MTVDRVDSDGRPPRIGSLPPPRPPPSVVPVVPVAPVAPIVGVGRLTPGQWLDFVAAGRTRRYPPGS